MKYTNNECVSTFHVIMKNGKFFVRHIFKGTNFDSIDDMKIYDLKGNPYIKRMSHKIYLTDELLKELKNIA